MEAWYWGLEYGKVLFGYLLIMFLWPAVVFGGHLKGKGITYRFSFCVTVQVVIANTAVLTLGLFHILRPQVIVVLFYGTFFFSLLKRIMRRSISFPVKEIWRGFRAHAGEYGVLIVLLLFGMTYFSYGAFQVHSYGFGDLYVHHAWIYGLQEGTIFSDGVYPEAMHCFIYCLNALFGIRVYSCLMFLQGIHVAVFLISGYLLMREIFHWRYTPLFALALFLTLDLSNGDIICGMFRLQITLPLEFGLHTQFLCALYLLRYAKSTRRMKRKKGLSKYYWDDNLFLFMMSLTASVSIHFYTTIMAFVLCVSFAVFMLKRLLIKERFIPLAACVLCACAIAIFPMAGALASAVPFNYSINWAIGVMDGEETRDLEGDSFSAEKDPIGFNEIMKSVYTEGYAALYGEHEANIILLVTGVAIALCLGSRRRLLAGLKEVCVGYPPLILFTVLFALLYAAPLLGYPEIISRVRVCSTGHMMMTALIMIPMDVIFFILSRCCKDMVLQVISSFFVAGIYALTIIMGHFHGYLYFELSRYNAAVEVMNQIIESLPEKSYVIVSPTDELYPMVEYGWHEELLTFVQGVAGKKYTLVPEHVFIYVEKRPLHYAQAYFFDGPSWLAQVKYENIFWDTHLCKYPNTVTTQAPEIISSKISAEEAQKDFDGENPWLAYTRLPSRTIIESKAYDWCQKFSELYPDKMNVYYEDDDFVCYHLWQDEGVPYNLGIG